MTEHEFGRRGIVRAVAAIALAGLVAACAWGTPDPAPVIMKGVDGGIAGSPGGALSPPIHQIVVRPGQSLGGIAQAYHVPKGVIIAANHLVPPYNLQIGQHLTIPGAADVSATPLLAAAPPVAPLAQGHPPPEIIPLDGPAPPRPIAAPATPGAIPPAALAAPQPPPPGPSAVEGTRAEPAAAAPLPHGSRFAWPVRGRVLAGYGVTAGGSHNDGINIAAPRGTPVAAVDAGTVAYAGNELRGYGNLVLIKHDSGWITAYAHCEELLVKRGDTVSRGQMIAKVGATGGVDEPQLHFELRRGKRAVDPREFLAPAPSAGNGAPAG